jgi:hypothetical protein
VRNNDRDIILWCNEAAEDSIPSKFLLLITPEQAANKR